MIEHCAGCPPAEIGNFFEDNKIEYRVIRLYDGDELPSPEEKCKAIVSLGGYMGAYDEEEYPFIKAEKAWLKAHALKKTPILGICLGCQLLADALGGKAYYSGKLEAGLVPIQVTDEGKADPVFAAFANPMLNHHNDTWDLPPGGTLLAESETRRQAFRFNGNTLGVQFHPESTWKNLAVWDAKPSPSYAKAGLDPNEVMKDVRGRAAEMATATQQFFKAWWKTVDEAHK